MKRFLKLALSTLTFFEMTATYAYASGTCYPETMQANIPSINETVLVVVDETTPRSTEAEKGFRENITVLLEKGAKSIVILSYAGNAPGQSLRVAGKYLIEDAVTDKAVIDDTIIAVYRKSQACVAKKRSEVKAQVTKSIDAIFATMPIAGSERSEILFATAATLKDFAQSGKSLLVLHYSDGLQLSKGVTGRNFYGGKGMPRKLDTKIEMGFVAKDPLTAFSKVDGAYVSVVWHGMLALPAAKGKDKPMYLDTLVIGSYVEFWTAYLKSLGADRIQIGTPVLNNVDLSLPSAKNPK